MLSIARYDRTYVDVCRGKIAASVEAFEALRAEVLGAKVLGSKALAAFEIEFFNGLVMVLDHYFDHRARAQEGKDGTALNEVRMLCNSFKQGNGKLLADKGIKYDPKRSQLGIAVGGEIAVDAAGFARLAEAFFGEIERKYP